MKIITLLIVVFTGLYLQAQEVFVEIKAGKYSRNKTPVKIILQKPVSLSKTFQLINRKTGKSYPAQLLDSVSLIFLQDPMPLGSTSSYALRASTTHPKKNPVTAEKKENGLLVKINNKPILFYHTTESMPPPDSPSYYKRSGFIHPLYSPNGKILTDDFPAGHVHQHGIFTAWTNTTFKNKPIDFWNQHHLLGTVEHVEILRIDEGPVFTQLKTRLRHKSLEHGEVLSEIWTLRIYPFSEYFLYDLESEQQNTTTDTLFVNKYHYGGFALRGSRHWNISDKKHFQNHWMIFTSEGMKDSMANHTRARWVDASGKIDGMFAGVTVFDHPSNLRYPQKIRVHPNMPYWTYCPVVDSGFNLAPGGVYNSRLRYYVHSNRIEPSIIENYYKDWSEPVQVRVYSK